METATKTLVVDASVVTKWLVPEKDTDKALLLRDAHIRGELTLIAPDLLIYEVANALRFHPETQDQKIHEDIEDLFTLELELIQPSSEFMSLVIQESRQCDISAYDASYFTLAGILCANLLTADERFYEKCRETGRVFRLQDFGEKWST